MEQHPAIAELISETRKIGRLGSALSLLGWDQETLMPGGGAPGRAEAIGELTEIVHRLSSSAEYGDRISAAEDALGEATGDHVPALVREVRRSYERNCKVPAELAEEIARTSSESLAAWKEARTKNEFSIFEPFLEKMFSLRRREAEAIGGKDDLYDILLDEYEPGCSCAEIERCIAAVKPALVELLGEIGAKSQAAPRHFLEGAFTREQQEAFARHVIGAIGFDFDRGRVDVSAHPFCSGIHSPGDVRLTTRYADDNMEMALFGLMHEAGHGIYEQGLDPEWRGTPVGSAVSMGIHESQSRLYENMVGRGRSFWNYFYPALEEHYGDRFDGVSLDEFLRAINRVEASLIRVEADEVTYNLHIMLRFEVERALLAGDLAPRDLPGLWNEKSKAFLGLEPPSDSDGCLQDIHWSFGAVGYFPTYFLGNLYAAQFYRAASETIPDLEGKISKGELAPLREWLGTNVHQPGSVYPAPELCERVTGKPLDPQVFLDYLTNKMRDIHG